MYVVHDSHGFRTSRRRGDVEVYVLHAPGARTPRAAPRTPRPPRPALTLRAELSGGRIRRSRRRGKARPARAALRSPGHAARAAARPGRRPGTARRVIALTGQRPRVDHPAAEHRALRPSPVM